MHATLGDEWRINDRISLKAEGYYNRQWEIPVVTDSLDLNFVADAKGRMYGIELMLRHEAGGRFFGWFAYSLARSTCQLGVGGDNPARNHDYGCEFTARRHLVEAWEEQRAEHAGVHDPYLDSLLRVRDAGYLDEYTVSYFGRSNWVVPAEVRVDDFRRWQGRHLRGHRPQTRIIGSWNYRPEKPTWSK